MNEKDESITRIIMATGLIFLLLCIMPFIVQSLLFFIQVGVTKYTLPAVCFGLGIFAIGNFIIWKIKYSYIFLWLTSIVVIVFLSTWLCISVYDFSYDGMWYHQDAVFLLAKGWNPAQHILSENETARSALFVNHYPKAVWISQACFYAVTNLLESAKVVNWFIMYATFCLSVIAIKHFLQANWFLSIFIALIITLNPVVVCQLFSFYVDGIVANVLACIILLTLLWIKGLITTRLFAFCIIVTSIFCINIKFTTIIYLGVFATGFLIYTYIFNRSIWLRIAGGIALTFILGTLAFGYSTYLRNTIEKGHPFYPIMGEKNLGKEIQNVPLPANFIDVNRFQQFNLATFAKPVWSRAPLESRPKALFTFNGIKEYDEFRRADAEMSGFGPLFAEVILVVLFGLIMLLVINRKAFTVPFIIFFFTLIISIIINPSFWYARYVPQLWLLIILLALFLYVSKPSKKLSLVILIGMLINIGLVMQQNFITHFKKTHDLNDDLVLIKAQEGKCILHPGWMRSFNVKLVEKEIPYTKAINTYSADSIKLIRNMEITGAFYVISSVK
ncbi:MAG: hypothetical protein MUE96_03490 [Bacteroidia bacterium]|jgi:hypothetical protein|nr:hypothetical protein [Bacteroidia bacterium]